MILCNKKEKFHIVDSYYSPASDFYTEKNAFELRIFAVRTNRTRLLKLK